MAAVERRKRRRKKFQNGKPMADSYQWVNLGNNSVDLEILAHKYMQKCTVESSTESESDANVEQVLNSNRLPEGLFEQTNHTKLKFLDPYDGDYEEISGTSDCSLDSPVDSRHSRVIFWEHPTPHALTPDDPFPPEGQEPLSASPYRAVSATVTQKDEPELQDPCEILQLPEKPSWLMGPDSSKHGRLHENTAPSSADQSMLECDSGMCEDPNVNRKQGRSVLENAGEKLRKKLRVT
ncbi:uncharacterized protein LOC128345254 isoform X3 [Hemicordylus capensis]|uniref:uncharacterized protein LOC128345254 isoform X3 n=1 Tax=Hemicordylus capensis TaxID=884348 RepID=UPI002302ADFB|nr:uncharacterized protein LOC128345254 isoform X3 [Hemicordylus capensis]